MNNNEWNEISQNDDINIYVAGKYNIGIIYHACYWKNGNFYNLPENSAITSDAMSIYINNDNIYISGNINFGANDKICYWINNKGPFLLEEPEGTTFSNAKIIKVIRGGIYIAGNIRIAGKDTACYWKNGNIVILEKSGTLLQTYAHDMEVVINNLNQIQLYIAGYSSDGGGPPDVKGNYWLNGKISLLPSIDDAYVNTSAINDGLPYFSGKYNDSGTKACYWDENKNIVDLNLGTNTEVKSMFINKNTIYFTIYRGAVINPVILKNNEKININTANECIPDSMYIFNDNIYVTGQERIGTYYPVIWRTENNYETEILEIPPGTEGAGSSIFVTYN